LINDVVYDIINQKRQLLKSESNLEHVTRDILGMMMVARDEETGRGLSDQELRDQVMTLMLAGHETTAVGMAWCLLMLATNQNVQDRARDEISSVIGSSVSMTNDILNKLEYCGCVVKETLRFLPPLPRTLRKAVQSDILPGGYSIPAGTIIRMSMGPMMRMDEVYDDAGSFCPDRFMRKDSETNVYNFAPFIYGPRQCLGHRFALVEMRTMLAVLLRQFRFDIDPTAAEYKRDMKITMRPSPSLQLRVSLVGHAQQ